MSISHALRWVARGFVSLVILVLAITSTRTNARADEPTSQPATAPAAVQAMMTDAMGLAKEATATLKGVQDPAGAKAALEKFADYNHRADAIRAAAKNLSQADMEYIGTHYLQDLNDAQTAMTTESTRIAQDPALDAILRPAIDQFLNGGAHTPPPSTEPTAPQTDTPTPPAGDGSPMK